MIAHHLPDPEEVTKRAERIAALVQELALSQDELQALADEAKRAAFATRPRSAGEFAVAFMVQELALLEERKRQRDKDRN